MITFDFGVVCEECGRSLSASFDYKYNHITVENCEDCMEVKSNSAYDKGFSEAELTSFEDGKTEGFELGKEEGNIEGYINGYAEGYNKGKQDGFIELLETTDILK